MKRLALTLDDEAYRRPEMLAAEWRISKAAILRQMTIAIADGVSPAALSRPADRSAG